MRAKLQVAPDYPDDEKRLLADHSTSMWLRQQIISTRGMSAELRLRDAMKLVFVLEARCASLAGSSSDRVEREP